MKSVLLLVLPVFLLSSAWGAPSPKPRLLTSVKPLPVALDPDFQFRKTKLFLMKEKADFGPKEKEGTGGGVKAQTGAGSKSSSAFQVASLTFERQYRLFGAVTRLDQRQRFGHYFDFFWRTKRPADVTVRLEYRQENLHAHIQAQELSYRNVRGSKKTEFQVVGDDYFDGGRVIAWRCLIIEGGRVVAENRSYLWE